MDSSDFYPKDPNRETVTEEMHPEKKWFAEAQKMDTEMLPAFIEKMIHGFNHDYGTSVHAVSACALATAWAVCGDENVGLSGFQAGFVMWDFIKGWTKTHNETGLKLLDYDNMLYPQYEHKFAKTIDTYTWNKLQKIAKKKLEEDGETAHPAVVAHWRSIVNGNVPFGYTVKDE